MSITAHGQGGQGRLYRRELQPLFNDARDEEEAHKINPTLTTADSSDRQSNKPGRHGKLNDFTRVKARFVKKFGPCADCKARKVKCPLNHFPAEYEQQYRIQLRNRQRSQQQALNTSFVHTGSGSGPGSIRTGHRPTTRQRAEPTRTTAVSTTSFALSSADRGTRIERRPSSRIMAATNSSGSQNQSQQLTDVGSLFHGQYLDALPRRDMFSDPALLPGLPFATPHRFAIGNANTVSISVPYAYSPHLVFGRRKYLLPEIWECLYGGDHHVLMSDCTIEMGLLACRRRFRSADELWYHFHRDHYGRMAQNPPEEYQFLHFCTLCSMTFSFAHWGCACTEPNPECWEERLYADIEKRGIISGSSQPVLPYPTRVDIGWP